MRGLTLVVSTIVGITPLAAQDPGRWEYSRLYVVQGIPLVWGTGDSVVQIDSAMAVMKHQTKTTPITLLMRTFDRLGDQGWELILTIPEANSSDATYLFKRHRK